MVSSHSQCLKLQENSWNISKIFSALNKNLPNSEILIISCTVIFQNWVTYYILQAQIHLVYLSHRALEGGVLGSWVYNKWQQSWSNMSPLLKTCCKVQYTLIEQSNTVIVNTLKCM